MSTVSRESSRGISLDIGVAIDKEMQAGMGCDASLEIFDVCYLNAVTYCNNL